MSGVAPNTRTDSSQTNGNATKDGVFTSYYTNVRFYWIEFLNAKSTYFGSEFGKIENNKIAYFILIKVYLKSNAYNYLNIFSRTMTTSTRAKSTIHLKI